MQLVVHPVFQIGDIPSHAMCPVLDAWPHFHEAVPDHVALDPLAVVVPVVVVVVLIVHAVAVRVEALLALPMVPVVSAVVVLHVLGNLIPLHQIAKHVFVDELDG